MVDWITKLVGGSVSEAVSGIGDAAIKLRTAITGDLPPDKRAELESLALSIESAARVAQNKVNEVEARHSSVFVSGWRPGVGWVCVAGLSYQFILYPLLCWGLAYYRPEIPIPPPLDGNAIMGLVTSMLGLGTIRQFGKNRGQG